MGNPRSKKMRTPTKIIIGEIMTKIISEVIVSNICLIKL